MQPFSYTNLKIIHNEIIEEALEQHRVSIGKETQRRNLLQAFGALLAHFPAFSARKPETTFPGCDREVEGMTC